MLTGPDLISGPAPDPITFEWLPGFLSPDEGQALYRAARLWPGTGPVIELGSWLGLSTCWMAFGCAERGRGRGDKVIAVDHFEGSEEHQHHEEIVKRGSTLTSFCRNICKADLFDFVEIINEYSTVAAANYKYERARFIFIDASHDLRSVSQDWDAWKYHLAPNAGIAFHDIGTWDGPTELYNKLISSYELKEIAAVGSLRIAVFNT